MKLVVTADTMHISMLELQEIMFHLFTELILKCREKDSTGSGSTKPDFGIMIIKHSGFRCFTSLVLASRKRGKFFGLFYIVLHKIIGIYLLFIFGNLRHKLTVNMAFAINK